MVKRQKKEILNSDLSKAKTWDGSVSLDDDLLLSDQINLAPMPRDPRKMSFILIGLCTKGQIKYRMDTEEQTVEAGDLLVVSERHIIEEYKPSEDMEGLCIMMSVDFFHEIIKTVHDGYVGTVSDPSSASLLLAKAILVGLWSQKPTIFAMSEYLEATAS